MNLARTSRLALASCVMVASLATSIVNVALPSLGRAFDAPLDAVRWVVVAYLLVLTVTSVSVGGLGDLVGRRRTLRVGLGLFVAASLVCGTTDRLWLLVVARGMQGLGAAAMMAMPMAFAAELPSERDAGHAMGLLGTSSAIGTAIGPTLGGIVIDALGWRAVFAVCVVLALGSASLLRVLPPDAPRADVTTKAAWRALSPRLPGGLVRDPSIGGGLTANLLLSAVLMTTMVVGPFHLAITHGLGARSVGLVLSIGPIVAALSGAVAGLVLNRLGARHTLFASAAGVAFGALAIALVPVTAGVVGYALGVAQLTASYAMFQAANASSVLQAAPTTSRGRASGALTLSRNLGLVIGAAVLGGVFTSMAAPDGRELAGASATSVAQAVRATFLAASALGLAGLVASTIAGLAGGPRVLDCSSRSRDRDSREVR